MPCSFNFDCKTLICAFTASSFIRSSDVSPLAAICPSIACFCACNPFNPFCNCSRPLFAVISVLMVDSSVAFWVLICAVPSFICFSESRSVFSFDSSCFKLLFNFFSVFSIFSDDFASFDSPLASSSAVFCCCLFSESFPSLIFFLFFVILSFASSSLPSTASFTFLFILSSLSCWMITSTFFCTSPDVLTDATPSTLSRSGMISVFARFVTSTRSIFSKSIAATMIGIISGLIFIMVGLPIVSSHWEDTISRLSLISIVAVFMSVLSLNSKITTETLLFDTDDTSFMLLILAIACSTGFVTADSTSSGLAPGYVVMTIAYGNSISGKRSVLILRNDKNPKTSISTTATNTV